MDEQEKTGTGRRAFFKRRDIIVIAAVLLAALIFWVAFPAGGPGAIAVVEVGYGDARTVERLSLSYDRVVEIDAALPVHLEIKDGAIRFIDSVCPDHDCERFGWQRAEPDWAACLPAGVNVRIEGG